MHAKDMTDILSSLDFSDFDKIAQEKTQTKTAIDQSILDTSIYQEDDKSKEGFSMSAVAHDSSQYSQ